jgi:hypothetical protein
MSIRRLLLTVITALGLLAGMLCASGTVTAAEVPLPVGGQGLPDNRAYELVTPVVKNGLDALGETELVHAAPSGDAVSFFSTGALPGSLGADATRLSYVALRHNGSWTTHGTAAPASTAANGYPEFLSIFPDLSKVFIEANEPQLAPGGTPGQYSMYEQDTATGAYQFFAPDQTRAFRIASVTPDDSHFIFEDEEQLLLTAASGHRNLYEWSNGQISLVGVLPESSDAPAGGSVAGSMGAGVEEYTQPEHTLSDDGSRVFFTDPGTGNLYVRENADAPNAKTLLIVEGAEFQAATADGSLMFYIKGEDLYSYNVETGQTDDVAPKGKVDGVLGEGGSGEDTYIYFAAGSVPVGAAIEGQPNIYVAHNTGGTWTSGFIATVSSSAQWASSESKNWTIQYEGGLGREKVSRVAPDGKTLLFSSHAPLTGYDNAEYDELYIYKSASAQIACVSCDPSGEPPTREIYLNEGISSGALGGINQGPGPLFPLSPTHNLSDSGARVVFETAEPLLPQDTNGGNDVYEWEEDGSDSCVQANGCLSLISTGRDAQGSYFADASASGDDVFFFTHQQLVPQDQEDELQDVYDARVDGGVVQVAPPACSGTGCQGVPAAPPIFATPSSVTFNGVGNFASAPPKVKAKAKSKAKRKPKKHKQKTKHKRKARKSTNRPGQGGK